MQCTRPIFVSSLGFSVPCRKCDACLLRRRYEWSQRLIQEMPYHDRVSFITLTYDDSFVPSDGSLVPAHLQSFFKRLRKNLGKLHPKIKYFAAGEYGDSFHRPHYHAIVFSLCSSSKEVVQSSWPYGFVHCVPASSSTIQYVTGYVQKKVFSKDDEYYTSQGLLPPFQRTSQGLGLSFCLENRPLFESVSSKGGSSPSHLIIPRYFSKKLELDTKAIRDSVEERSDDELEQLCLKYKPNLAKYRHDFCLRYNRDDVPSSVLVEYIKRDFGIYRQRERDLRAKFSLSETKKRDKQKNKI